MAEVIPARDRSPFRSTGGKGTSHEALLAWAVILVFSLGVLGFYFGVLIALGQADGILEIAQRPAPGR